MSNYLFEPHPRQQQFLERVFDPQYTYLAYGGAAGGGKTFVGLGGLILLCRLFKNSRWCVLRENLNVIKLNTLPSFWKICPTNFVNVWNKSDFTCTFRNNSQIIFKGENAPDDPEIQWMDGLEVNGFLLEQVEELREKTYDKAKLRAGRHIINPMPPIKILMTLNPAQNWVKKVIYEPFIDNKIKPPYSYTPALIEDNPSLPETYVSNLKFLDRLTYARYVEGNWSAFAVDMPFAYAFDRERHISKAPLERDPMGILYLSFDFNVDPITCLAAQWSEVGKPRILKEFRLENSDIYALCERIRVNYPDSIYMITGDATGRARSALVAGNINYYTVIKQQLRVTDNAFKQPSVNPSVGDSRVLLNSILQNGELIIDPSCAYLAEDLVFCEVDEGGDIDKKKDKHKSHLLDCLRYLLSTWHSAFIKRI